MTINEMIKSEIVGVLEGIDLIESRDIASTLEVPPNPEMGDIACNISFSLSKELKKSPNHIAQEIANGIKVPKGSVIERVAVKGGYINFYLSLGKLSQMTLKEILNKKNHYGSSDMGKGKKYMVEFAHPNTHKLFHIGHLRNISIGEAMVRIFEFTGHEVIRVNYQGDVGLHIAKCLYGILNTENYEEVLNGLKTIEEKMAFLGKCYAAGSKAYEENDKAKSAINDMNSLVYASAQRFNKEERGLEPGSTDYLKFVQGKGVDIDKVYMIWKRTRLWSLEHFEKVYRRVYSHFDRYYFESECLAGVDLANEAERKGVLKKSEGAIIFDGEPYGLDKRVFVNNMGLPTYEAKELKLAQMEFSEFGKIEKCLHVVGPEQSSFFKVTFKVEELLDPQKFKDRQFHLVYGWVRLKEGKMSSRLGNVVVAEDIMNEAKSKLKGVLKDRGYSEKEMDKISEMVAIGAVKYSMLKISTTKEISFDVEESLSFEGDSSPYLQYAHVRAGKILEKAGSFKKIFKVDNLAPEEGMLVKKLVGFPEVVGKSTVEYKPNLIADYAYDLAETFSTFYHACPVIKSEGELRDFRLTLTEAFKVTLKNCLDLLGIETPEIM
ncbi:arginine--tRNA ligase [Candidatus Micrarchaeota archaeon RBG_16_49_10]|nr:MAG: arginine--tRNA ligase [Candidatus Micrarchaeota archaeon RBG_16_49_10]